ncbi:MAG: 4Fe-4S binding protein [Bacteroidia bacterium]|nr:4Fe-4S binding protein [Bacteroidia bacterium]
MQRDILEIDEAKCNGCGLCVPTCHEGALQIIDGKVRLVSELMCDGLGACIGHCPEGAITIIHREAVPYDEVQVMELMVSKGLNTVVAHLRHLKSHEEFAYLKQGMGYIMANESSLSFTVEQVRNGVHSQDEHQEQSDCHGGCPGSKTVVFEPNTFSMATPITISHNSSELRQWPTQLHLINTGAAYFAGSDLLVAADCSAFTIGDFHQKWLRNKTLVIACPKLDQSKELYIQKITALIDQAKVNTITVLILEVPCCSGLVQLVKMSLSLALRKVPVKVAIASIKGEIVQEEWI